MTIEELLIKSIEKNIRIVDNDFKKGYWEGLYVQTSLIEAILKFILATNMRKQKRLNNGISKHIKNCGFYVIIQNCFIAGIIKKDLYKKLEKYRKQRNILVHKMFLDPKRLEKLDFKEMKNIGKEICKNLIFIIKKDVKIIRKNVV